VPQRTMLHLSTTRRKTLSPVKDEGVMKKNRRWPKQWNVLRRQNPTRNFWKSVSRILFYNGDGSHKPVRRIDLG